MNTNQKKAFKKCKNCPQHNYCRNSLISWIFFAVALIATIALRVVSPLNFFNQTYGKIAWYTGVSGFFIFFLYKFKIDYNRSMFIKRKGIVSKIRYKKPLSKDDYNTIDAIFCTLSSKKDMFSFFFISIFSILALIFALYFDFFKNIGGN
jgi:hypothetical protein